MKLALILMIKNESKILKRCLEAVEKLVDCFCICDTGSTDNTVEIANDFLSTRKGCLTVEPWQNFGHNRTVSFQNAQTYLKENNWDLNNTYGLLLDADMVFMAGKLKGQKLTSTGYKLIQLNGALEYYNTRLVRMDFPWKCVSVTHEYWDGPCDSLSKDICYIDDRNDGGCKHDKFERDQRLLEKGLEDEPTNVRYMFYLAQTYRCLGKYDDAITMYKKRIEAGGWAEEVWYSMYMIGECYKGLNNIFNFEEWMQRAHAFRPSRSESIYKLAELYRIKGDHYKAYHYTKIGLDIPFPKNDILFIETDVYNGKFLYEASVLDYYVHQDKRIGLRDSIKFLMVCGKATQNVLSNMKFYISPISSNITKLDIPQVFGDNFTPSAISIATYPYANVRFVNYLPPVDGQYRSRDGSPIETKNAYFNLETSTCIAMMNEPVYTHDSHIRGLEDLRLYTYDNKLMFTATSFKQFIHDKICIVHGEYDKETKTYIDYQGIQSPTNSGCEKNWVNIPETDEFIYSWHPLTIGKIRNDKFYITKKIQTPVFFELLRGSAPPIEVDGKWLVLVHFVEYCQPRKYYHCFIEVEKTSYKITKISLPFVFRQIGIEYCISVRLLKNNKLECYTSFIDTEPSIVEIKLEDLNWLNI
jgi:glycosyltransferase involved in cell wall biosynthesis